MATVQAESKPQVTRHQALGWLRQMLLIRRFEERSAMLYQNQLIGGFFILEIRGSVPDCELRSPTPNRTIGAETKIGPTLRVSPALSVSSA